MSLPGIGRSTAAAIAAFASGERRAILDGNVKRVLARHAGIGGDPGTASVLTRLWDAAEARLPARAIEPYTQGLMDLGAGVCLARAPRCALCPVAQDCRARIEDRTTELPGRKRKAPVRRRSAHLLVELSGGYVRVEKRPSPGIWGGLWSLPEVAAAALPARAVPLEPFEHAFTHFTLAIQPWRLQSRKRPRAEAKEGALTWLPLSEVESAALPAPVKRLLLRIRSAPAGA